MNVQVPKVDKIVVNCGIGEAAQNAKGLDAAMNDLALITGQRPIKTRAKKAIATFKIREGQPLGIACTLRGSVRFYYSCYFIYLSKVWFCHMIVHPVLEFALF